MFILLASLSCPPRLRLQQRVLLPGDLAPLVARLLVHVLEAGRILEVLGELAYSLIESFDEFASLDELAVFLFELFVDELEAVLHISVGFGIDADDVVELVGLFEDFLQAVLKQLLPRPHNCIVVHFNYIIVFSTIILINFIFLREDFLPSQKN